MGLPTVGIVAKGFLPINASEFKTRGLPRARRAVMPHPFTEMPEEEVAQTGEALYDTVVYGLTHEGELLFPPKKKAGEAAASDKPVKEVPLEHSVEPERITIEGEDYFDWGYNLNRYFIKHGWGDGFPIVPPTEEAVNRMLTGTKRGRHEVILKMQPGMGLATVEKIAANCVMAGCEPAHLPILIAIIEAMDVEEFVLTILAQSTGAHAPILLVNGPIAKQIRMNSEACCFGPGKDSVANTAIGRAVRLCMMNIGFAYARIRDMDTIGSPIKYSFCAAENEAENPWEPFSVEKGFKPGSNCVTAIPCQSLMEIEDMESDTPETLLRTFASSIDSMGWLGARSWLGYVTPPRMKVALLLAPDHARMIANAGWSKFDVKQYLYAKCRRKWGQFKHQVIPRIESKIVLPGYRWLINASDDTMVPMVRDYGYFDIAVVGGAAGKSAVSLGLG